MADTALLVIDMQQDMADRIATGRDAAPGGVADRVAGLLARARVAGVPVVHIHHDDPDPDAAIRLDRRGGMPMACARPVAGEAVIVKRGSSGFAGTGLDACLRDLGAGRIVVTGAVLGFCVSSTIRDAVALGYAVDLVGDAVLSFALPAGQGGTIPAAWVHAVHAATLAPEFVRGTTAAEVVFG